MTLGRIIREFEKKMENLDHQDQQATKMSEVHSKQIELQKAKLEDTRVKFRQDEIVLDMSLQEAEKK